MRKNIVLLLIIIFIVLISFFVFFKSLFDENDKIKHKDQVKTVVKVETPTVVKQNVVKPAQPLPKVEKTVTKIFQNIDLYSDDNTLPLSTIVSIKDLADEDKEFVQEIIENSNLYYLRNDQDKLLLVISNSGTEKFIRHNIQIIEINSDGDVRHILEDISCDVKSKENKWIMDKTTDMPLKHIKYDSNGDVEYTEIWNYLLEEPIKYEVKNGEGKTISLRKETNEESMNARVEELVYDENGNIKFNISINYEGPDIVRFTYYDASNLDDSVILVFKYNNGEKIEENVYSSSYQKIKTYKSEYQDGERTNIKVFNNLDEEIEEYTSL